MRATCLCACQSVPSRFAAPAPRQMRARLNSPVSLRRRLRPARRNRPLAAFGRPAVGSFSCSTERPFDARNTVTPQFHEFFSVKIAAYSSELSTALQIFTFSYIDLHGNSSIFCGEAVNVLIRECCFCLLFLKLYQLLKVTWPVINWTQNQKLRMFICTLLYWKPSKQFWNLLVASRKSLPGCPSVV